MNAVKILGFTADSSTRSNQLVVAAESVPGGPGNVPSGYGRDCQRLPMTVCAGNRCWTEYYWQCTYYPIRTQ